MILRPASRDGLLDPIQINVVLFLLLLLSMAITNYMFAKISFTRKLIDKHLGNTFISDHEVNTRAIQILKIAGPLAAAAALKTGDDYITARANVQMVIETSQALNNAGIKMTQQQVDIFLNRPSTTQQAISAVLERLKK